MGYTTKNYRKQGGEEWVVGGEIDVTGKAKIGSTAITASDRIAKVAKVALGAADTGGGVLSWKNEEGAAIIIRRILLDVTTKATGACTIDVGTTDASATTSSDNLLDGLDINTSTGVFDNLNDTDNGTNGKLLQKLADGKWVTGSKASGAAAGTVGFAYIEYVII